MRVLSNLKHGFIELCLSNFKLGGSCNDHIVVKTLVEVFCNRISLNITLNSCGLSYDVVVFVHILGCNAGSCENVGCNDRKYDARIELRMVAEHFQMGVHVLGHKLENVMNYF